MSVSEEVKKVWMGDEAFDLYFKAEGKGLHLGRINWLVSAFIPSHTII